MYGWIIKLPKKGDRQSCNNLIGIALLSVAGKILNRMLLSRKKDTIDILLREEQVGFSLGRSSTDQITTLRIILDECLEWQTPLAVSFVDFQKAFDSLHRETLWNIAAEYGIPQHTSTS